VLHEMRFGVLVSDDVAVSGKVGYGGSHLFGRAVRYAFSSLGKSLRD
jgi:hypothetical protein